MWKDSETELDFLDFDYLIEIMKDTINDVNLLPSSVGLYGDWGSGKSSLMNMCKNSLENDDENILCLVFNGWLYEGYDDAKTAILAAMLDGIRDNRGKLNGVKDALRALYESVDKFKLIKGGVKFGAELLLTGGISAISGLTINAIWDQIKGKIEDIDEEIIIEQVKDKLNYKELREDIKRVACRIGLLNYIVLF